MHDTEAMLTPKDVAQIYGISIATLSTWRATQQGPKWYRLGTRLVRYRKADMEQWIQEQNR